MIEQVTGAAQKSKGVGAHRAIFQYEPIGISPLVEDKDAFNNITLRGHGQSKEVMKGQEFAGVIYLRMTRFYSWSLVLFCICLLLIGLYYVMQAVIKSLFT